MTTPPLSTRKLRLRVLSTDDHVSLEKSRGIASTFNEVFDACLAAEREAQALPALACSKGCAYCCTHDQPVLMEYEAQSLMGLVIGQRHLLDVMDTIREHLAIALQHWKFDGPAPLPVGMLPCPFLGPDRACRIYDDRPMGCRAASSPDADRCAAGASIGDRSPWSPDTELMFSAMQRIEMAPEVRLFLRRQVERAESKVPLSIALALLLYPEAKMLIMHAAGQAARVARG